METSALNTNLILDVLDLITSKANFETINTRCAESGVKLNVDDYKQTGFRILSNAVVLTIKIEEQRKISSLYEKRVTLTKEMDQFSKSFFKKEKFKSTKQKLDLVEIEISALENEYSKSHDQVLDSCSRLADSLIEMLRIETDKNLTYNLKAAIKEHFLKKTSMQLA